MKVVTRDEIRRIDKRAIEEYGISGLILMENAGLQVSLEILEHYSPLAQKRVAIIAGKGNNGGDGFVVARHLYNRGIRVEVYLIGESTEIKGDARVNLDILKKIGIPLYERVTSNDLSAPLRYTDIIVDAIFGTGLSSEIKNPYSDVINAINSSRKPVVSIDVPSGVDSDTGEILGVAVKADITVTFALPKRGLLVFPGAEYAGILKIGDIGIPKRIIGEEDIRVNLLTRDEVRASLPPRRPDSYKTSFGHLLVMAGSPGKTGAAAMTSLSALRVGAGLVTLATPKSLNEIFESKLTEVMTLPLPETDDLTISDKAEEIIYQILPKMAVIAIGPGLSIHPETTRVVRHLVKRSEIPMVIDADGINALIGHLDILKEAKAPLILTPHPGEMARLLGITPKDIQKDRIGIAQRFAKENRVFLVLKGARTIISDPHGDIFINPTGNPGMATAGTGDVLTGMISGLIAQGMEPLTAAKTGVYLHGLTGDISAEEFGEMGMIAGDMIERIPKAIKSLKMSHYHPSYL